MPAVARTDSRDTAAEKFGVDRVRSGPEKAERDGIGCSDHAYHDAGAGVDDHIPNGERGCDHTEGRC